MIQCPNCGFKLVLDEDKAGNVTTDAVNQACRLAGVEYTNSTRLLILRLANECSDKRSITLLKFLNNIKKYPYSTTHVTISEFFALGLHKKGYGLSYVVGMIKNKHERAKSQDKWLSPLPKAK